MNALQVEAPTDAQLSYLAKLADERQFPMPDSIRQEE